MAFRMSTRSAPRQKARSNDPPDNMEGDDDDEILAIRRKIRMGGRIYPPAEGAPGDGPPDSNAADGYIPPENEFADNSNDPRPEWTSPDEEPPMPPRFGSGVNRKSATPLDHHLLPMADALTSDMVRETAGRDIYAALCPTESRRAAATLVRYRLSTLAVIRKTGRDARMKFLSDLRGLGRGYFPEMQMAMHLFSRFFPIMHQRGNVEDPPFEEAALPIRPRNYAARLCC